MTSLCAFPYSIRKAVELILLEEEEQRQCKSLQFVSGKEGRKGKGLSTVSPALIASPRPSPAVAPQCNASAVFTPLLVSWPAK